MSITIIKTIDKKILDSRHVTSSVLQKILDKDQNKIEDKILKKLDKLKDY